MNKYCAIFPGQGSQNTQMLTTYLDSEEFQQTIEEASDVLGYNVKEGKQMGLISEEVAETIPELAIMKDGKPKNVDYQKLAVVLLAEVQNLKKEIEEIKSK